MSFSQRLSAAYYAALHRDIRARMAETGVDVLLLDSNDDVIYTTGFSHYTTERPVVFAMTQQNAYLLVPELERHHATEQHTAAELVVYFEFPGRDRPFAVLGRTLGDIKGVVAHSPGISLARAPQIEAAFPNATVRASGIVGHMRLAKRPEELVLQREAARISDSMVSAGVALIAEALRNNTQMPTEIDIESHIIRHALDTMYREHEDIMLVQGTAGGLVYSGKRSAFPHGMPSGHQPQRGESMILSLGCRVGGRAAESERTFILGEPTKEQEWFYTTAQQAQEIGTAGLVAGATCASADDRALDFIRDAGMGPYCLHRVGHGMGVMFHEPPWVEGGDDTILVPGMVCSSEPALYVPGLGGFRLADTVLVTQDGPESLTQFPRKLDEIIIA
ncbi:M24 family metallopeptidase [Devosia rhizoryzae]|uniref:Aminopeptidase P family protein n=1 Tax=Devosia rhizoryzae TaxID=2774137 RepID=A0ABX7CDP5_9HYPH|nr:Xaa-Pro peptidase family protein [Devosia rhizoryzae]QQR40735.1 aminopeptidase P family protein [Devosia rhizoryzae]